VSDTVEYQQLEPSGQDGADGAAGAEGAEGAEGAAGAEGAGAAPGANANGVSHVDIDRLSDIPMELSVEIGRTHMTVGETLDLRVGSVVALERLAGETADLLVNGSAIARGEVVVIDEQYGLRITEILDSHQDPPAAPPPTPAANGRPGADQDASAHAHVPEQRA
jgi:flagellar motor switch protein FliN